MKKKILILIALLMFVITLNAQTIQSPWYGFGKSVKYVIQDKKENLAKESLINPNTVIPTTNTELLFRPAFTLTALAIDLSQKPANFASFTSAGFGLSYGKFSTVDAYCYYSVNALMLTAYKIGGVEEMNVGAAITVDAYNKLIGAGVGYINNHIMPLITISYSF
jgi:hypothetical protein